VAYLAWKHAGLARQEVGKADPATGLPNPMTTKATKVPKGGAGEARLSDGVETERHNPLWLRHATARREAGLVLGRLHPAMAPGARWVWWVDPAA
jgi:hypothetical protein